MEFDFDVGRVLVPFALEGDAGEGTPQVARLDDSALNGGKGALLRELLGVLGEGSRRAQGLSKPVTTAGPLMSNRIYLLYMGRYALGLLKVGTKRLFVSRGEKEGLVDISPTCVLDFYVVEGHQRGGLGRRLFDTMLRCEHTSPERLAYDRPSPKLIGFLRRHYGLAPYQPQANHFVVFDAYWAKAGAIRDSSARDCEKFRRPEGPGTGGKTSACTGALGTELIGDEGNETQVEALSSALAKALCPRQSFEQSEEIMRVKELPENLKAEEAAAIFRLVLHGRLESRSATLSKEKRQRTPKPQVSHFPERWHRRWRLSFEVSALERQLSTVRGELEEDAPLKELGNWAERKFAMESQRLQSLEKELGNTEVRLGTKVQEMNAEAACCASPAQVARIRLDLESKLTAQRTDLEGRVESQAARLRDLPSGVRDRDLEARLRAVKVELEGLVESRNRGTLDLFESRLADLRNQIEDKLETLVQSRLEVLRQECHQDAQSCVQEAQVRLSEDVVALQQRLVAELRAETTTALNRESAALAALDEQLWITDQRLGQRIDELAQSRLRERSASGVKGGRLLSSILTETFEDSDRTQAEPVTPEASSRRAAQRISGGEPRPGFF
ncbi:unnamed protein product [Symbiodinium microadriaticum]|nr:unnamed protein product [Symbiodinium microadriaticum]